MLNVVPRSTCYHEYHQSELSRPIVNSFSKVVDVQKKLRCGYKGGV